MSSASMSVWPDCMQLSGPVNCIKTGMPYIILIQMEQILYLFVQQCSIADEVPQNAKRSHVEVHPAQSIHQELCCADMSALEAEVRGVNKDGLLWGACELPPLLSYSHPVCMTASVRCCDTHAAFIARKPSAHGLALCCSLPDMSFHASCHSSCL